MIGLFFLAQNDVISFMSDIFETVGREVIYSSLNTSNCVFGEYWHSTDAERLLLGTGTRTRTVKACVSLTQFYD